MKINKSNLAKKMGWRAEKSFLNEAVNSFNSGVLCQILRPHHGLNAENASLESNGSLDLDDLITLTTPLETLNRKEGRTITVAEYLLESGCDAAKKLGEITTSSAARHSDPLGLAISADVNALVARLTCL